MEEIQAFLFDRTLFTHAQARKWLDEKGFIMTKSRSVKEGSYIKYTVGHKKSDENCKIYNVDNGIFYKL